MDDEGFRRDIVGCVRLSFKLRAFSFKSRAFSLYKFMYVTYVMYVMYDLCNVRNVCNV